MLANNLCKSQTTNVSSGTHEGKKERKKERKNKWPIFALLGPKSLQLELT